MAELTLPAGIPESIPFARVQELIAAFGLPVDQLEGFHLHANAIEAQFYATDDNGVRFVRGTDGVPAMHSVVIRVDRGDDETWRFVRRPNIHDDGPAAE